MTSALELSAFHDAICIDHELDSTVNAGIAAVPQFKEIFDWANSTVSLISCSSNLWRTLRNAQVVRFHLPSPCFSSIDWLFLISWTSGWKIQLDGSV